LASASVLYLALIGLYAAILIFASTLGGRPERIAAGIYVANLAATWFAQASGDAAPFYAFMLIDFVAAVGFGWLMLKNPEKLWPGIAACAQLLVFVFSATRALEFPLSETGYLVMLNVCSLLGIGALAAGTWAARWRRGDSPGREVAPA
jgi:hypothetical protein